MIKKYLIWRIRRGKGEQEKECKNKKEKKRISGSNRKQIVRA